MWTTLKRKCHCKHVPIHNPKLSTLKFLYLSLLLKWCLLDWHFNTYICSELFRQIKVLKSIEIKKKINFDFPLFSLHNNMVLFNWGGPLEATSISKIDEVVPHLPYLLSTVFLGQPAHDDLSKAVTQSSYCQSRQTLIFVHI